MSAGSGIFDHARPVVPPLVTPGKGGIAGEVGDLRRDVANALHPMAAIAVEEFTNALAAAANNMMAATASVATTAVQLNPIALPAPGSLMQATITNLAAAPRQLQFTTAGVTPAHQPSVATIHGKNERGKPQVEVVTLLQTAGSVLSTMFWGDVDYVLLAADGGGAGATLAVGLGDKIGLSQPVVKRAGVAALLTEVTGGAVIVPTGTMLTAADGTAATVTGTVDLVTPAPPAPVMPTVETLVMAVDGAAALTLTFATPADRAAVIAAINAVWPGVATASGNFIALTSPTTGVGSKLDISAASTSLVILGLTAAITSGVGNGTYGSYKPAAALNGTLDFAVYYEYASEV